MWKHFVSFGLLFTMIVGYVFWRTHREENTVPIPVAVEEQSRSEEPNKAQRLRQIAHERHIQGQPISDYRKKKLAIMNTPGYEAFLETGSRSLYETLDFFASHGLEVNKSAFSEVFDRKFREHFPGETPASAESQVRQELIDRLEENDAEDHLQVAMEFVAEERYNAWGSLYFETDDAAFGKWAFNILKNYHQPVASPPVIETEGTVFTTEPLTPVDELSGDFPTVESSVTPQGPSANPTVLEADDIFTESDIDVEAEIQKLLDSLVSDTLEFPAEVDLEKNLVEFEESPDERFSSKRFDAALKTLSRYGPEEGLRRLKESDPEFATHMERYIQGKEDK